MGLGDIHLAPAARAATRAAIRAQCPVARVNRGGGRANLTPIRVLTRTLARARTLAQTRAYIRVPLT